MRETVFNQLVFHGIGKRSMFSCQGDGVDEDLTAEGFLNRNISNLYTVHPSVNSQFAMDKCRFIDDD
jgi:hypothetical protein